MSSITSPNSSARPTSPPDWETILHEVKCPLCDYNLRGLSEPRCPECGYQFDWSSVVDPNQQRHPYLFEHYTNRNFWSFASTLIHHLKPMRFWRTVEPTHRIRPLRIALYWLICTVAVLLPVGVGIAQLVRYRSRWIGLPRGGRLFGFIISAVGHDGFLLLTLGSLLLAFFPWVNFAALMIFQQSMRRAKVKPGHVLRCAVYSGDVIFWFALAATAAILWFGPNLRPGQPEQLLLLLTLGFLLAAAINAARLWIAYAQYMKFKGALATILASQLIVGLTIFTVFMHVMTRR